MKIYLEVSPKVRIVETTDRAYPFGLEVDGVVVTKSITMELVNRLANDAAYVEEANKALD